MNNSQYAAIDIEIKKQATADDGSLVLTGTARGFTAASTDNGDGTATYVLEVLNVETNVTCAMSSIASLSLMDMMVC